MKQKFSLEIHEKFKKYFQIKNSPSEIDNLLFEKAYKYIAYIKWIAWIKFIWIWNSTSMFASKETSDIDLFIITSKNRMWFVRILITLIFGILWVRKNAKYHEKRFCLSFFATENSLDFKDFALENDVYLYYRLVYLKPILDFDNTYEIFINSQTWADFSIYKDNFKENKKFIKFSWNSFWNNCKILDFTDKILKNIFLPKTLKSYEKLWKPYGIVINDDLLKFHDDDRRKQIKESLLN